MKTMEYWIREKVGNVSYPYHGVHTYGFICKNIRYWIIHFVRIPAHWIEGYSEHWNFMNCRCDELLQCS